MDHKIYIYILSFLHIEMAPMVSVWNSVKKVVGPHALNLKS